MLTNYIQRNYICICELLVLITFLCLVYYILNQVKKLIMYNINIHYISIIDYINYTIYLNKNG